MTYKTEKQDVFNYKGQILEFNLGEEIGRGGNGTVYKINYREKSQKKLQGELVAKILKLRDGNSFSKKYNRFKIEVEAGRKLNEISNRFLPIIDCNLPEKLNECNKPWYVMPFAESFAKYLKNSQLSIQDKISLIIEIGEAIKILHDNGYAHRDIKLANILIYQDKIVLCDFGLIRHDSLKRLTNENEPVGPWNTIAPEMKRVASKFTVPKEADIYSFGKLIWIILTEDEYCFDGRYSRNDMMSLNSQNKTKACGGLRILHELLERTTENLPESRPSIDEVLKKLYDWRNILDDEDMKRKIDNLELYEEITNHYSPTEYVYTKPEEIYNILNMLIKDHNLYKDRLGVIGPILDIKRLKIENYFKLKTKNITYIFSPVSLKYMENKWYLNTAEIDKKVLEREGIVLNNKKEKNILYDIFSDVFPQETETYQVIDADNDILLKFKY